MNKSSHTIELAKAPEMKYIPWKCVLHATQGLHSTPQQLHYVNIDCVIDRIPKKSKLILIKMRECHSILDVFCLVLLFKNTSNCNINQAWMNLKEKKREVGVKQH